MNTLPVTQPVIEITYLMASILFILSLKWMSSPSTARRGIWAGEIGMLLAIGGTLLQHGIVDYTGIAIALAARFKRPWTILLAILVATLVNHTVAGYVGVWLRQALRPGLLRGCLGVSFLLAALWALKPDSLEQDPKTIGQARVFAVTLRSSFS